ncbi:hypothetical protein [Brevibacterium sp. JSBI002]|uniref:hypothetical protein n=1 Tax=Brevibacterium sp. JSBI002 TaxID=2886045 RepID=UPI00222EF4CA|nr:hypothetical protein [Brevibacterium sp. JSBI002]UZD63662.1 hypothetical protein LJ362_07505 [Brevibacterium sp. JSBI002]
MTDLHINDPLAMRDLSAFASLAHRADADGAMRLQVASDVLAATVAPLFPHGLGDSTPLVLAMRMLRLDDHEQDGFDEAVPLSNLLDRFARDENGTTLPVPPNSVLVSWTGIAPPRGGWSEYNTISVGRLHETAESGIAEISTGAPEGSGGHAVKALRSRVWSRPMTGEQGAGMPGGLAFAAAALRFIPPAGRDDDRQLRIMESGSWLRLVAPGGHLLTRARGL